MAECEFVCDSWTLATITEQGSASRRFNQGWPRTTTSADDQYLLIRAQRNRTETPVELKSSFAASSGRLVSRSNVHQRLHERGLYARQSAIAFHSRHAIGGNVCSGRVNMSTGRMICGELFFLRVSAGFA
ncbi:HTH_Tnp_Tc3_2 domain-containing protein [Trichonephila clavipes]|nr:HTH_Tnp_Tc3_2 domain-containing protein [Trichonephila clavipes]